MTAPRLEPGAPAPLGASWDGSGVNFALVSRHGEQVELCLFDPRGERELARLPLPGRSGDVWHGRLAGAEPGLVYGYRVHGPYQPERGHRFNPHKLLLDPYTRALVGELVWDDAVFGYDRDDPAGTSSFNARDSAPFVPKCRVVAPAAARLRPPRPDRPWRDTLIYELHVRGHTRLHPEIPAALRGTLAALAEPAALAHFHALGVTALELLPIAAFLDEAYLPPRGLSNYWGYNPIAFLVPHAPYLAGASEGIEAVVDRLHAAGLELLLDVVFNHTAEGDERGPTLCYRGLDNALYYRLRDADPGAYQDYSGCGNTLDLSEPHVAELVLAALRRWAGEIGVDGFRFDLATALARDAAGNFDPQAPLLRALLADPELSRRKLIVEPWDVGHPGYSLGQFPRGFAEWNDRFRDGVRRLWSGAPEGVAEFVTRLAGSSDVFGGPGRGPLESINHVTCHDGFTLADLVSYRVRRNEANGNDNLDGPSDALSLCVGPDGPSDAAAVVAARGRRQRALLATLLLARGVPMLLGGDELSRSQGGNNNAYCQDNPTSWLDWSARGDTRRDLREFVAEAVALRRRLRGWCGDFFLAGGRNGAGEPNDVLWLDPDGRELEAADWQDPLRRALVVLFGDQAAGAAGAAAFTHRWVVFAFNADEREIALRLPAGGDVREWLCVLDSSDPDPLAAMPSHPPGDAFPLAAGAVAVFVPASPPRSAHDPALRELAELRGIQPDYFDVGGRRRVAREHTLRRLLEAMGLERERLLTPGPALAHEVAIERSRGVAASAPRAPGAARCWQHAGLGQGAGLWALSVQLYALRSARSWGIGDFDDLGHLAELAATVGAAGILLSPLHALFLAQPERASPYAPSSRLALNPLLISVPLAAELDAGAEFGAWRAGAGFELLLARARQGDCIDYARVAALKRQALEVLFRDFRARHLGAAASARGDAFRRFQREQSDGARGYAWFEALSEHLAGSDGRPRPWQEWPAPLRRIHEPEVAAFARAQPDRVAFFEYLQWLAAQQWDAACARAKRAGLALGFITDLAVGAAADGAEAWAGAEFLALGAEIGAPPDPFSAQGQAWGAPPFDPRQLEAAGFAPFRAVLRAAMRGAGAVRIDHVMALARQFWVPRGEPATRGAYVQYPLEALLEVLADESLRHRCSVIGEDLGTVPGALRERLHDAGMFGYRVMYFERERDGAFIAPGRYPPQTVAAISTHDLPTIAGYFAQADIDERVRSGLYPAPEAVARARAERTQACARLGEALAAAGLGEGADSGAARLHRLLAASASRLVLAQLDDVLEQARQANLPDLGDSAPNWRQRLPLTLEALAGDARFTALAEIFARRNAHGTRRMAP